MKKLLNKIFFVAIFFALSGVAYLIYSRSSSASNENENGKRYGKALKKDLVQRVTFAGSIIPLKKSIVTAPYNGYVKKIFVKVGDKVALGDPIVSIVQSLQSGDNPFPLRAPLSGTVVQVQKSEGEYVKEGDSSEFIMRIDDSSKFYVVANAPEIDRVKIKDGQQAVIKVSAIGNRVYNGILRDLSLAAKDKEQWGRSQVVEFPIRIEITDSDKEIRSGMSVVVDVITGKKENVLSLRHEYIRREGEKYFVVLASGIHRDIEVGLQNEEGFEIISGLQEGEDIAQIDFSELDLKD